VRLSATESPRLGPRAAEWDALVAAMALPSPFLRSWWLEAVSPPGSVFVLCLDDQGALAGGLALQQDRFAGVDRLALAGTGPLCPDHLDAVARAGEEEEVAQALAGWLAGRAPVLVDLDGVAGGSLLRRALPEGASERLVDLAPYQPLDGGFDAYLASRSPQLRNTLRRRARALEREGAQVVAVAQDQPDRLVDDLRRLHQAQFGASSGFLPAFAAFARAAPAGIERGELRFAQVRAGGRAVAVEVWFEVAGRLSFYQGGRHTADRRFSGAGTVLMGRVVERACREGLAEIDLLRGQEPYKWDWAGQARPVYRIRAALGAPARAALGLLEAGERARRGLGRARRAARRLGGVPSRPPA